MFFNRLLVFFCGYLLAHSSAYAHEPNAYFRRVMALGGNFTEVAVLGGGCAGLSAGFTAAQLCHTTVIFMGSEPGGQLMGSQLVENIPGVTPAAGYVVIEFLENQALQAGARTEYTSIVHVACEIIDGATLFVLTTDNGIIWTAASLIIAMGASARKLNVPGEKEYLNNNIFTCARCDGRQTEGETVYVLGGGDASVDAIMTLLGFGAKEIVLLVRGERMRAAPLLQARLAQQTQISIEYRTKLIEARGTTEELKEIVTEGPQGRVVRPARFVFYAIGHIPNTQSPWLRSLVTCDQQGYIMVNAYQQTSCQGIYAAGDIASPYFHQASYALGCGQLAAKYATDYVKQLLPEQLKKALAPLTSPAQAR